MILYMLALHGNYNNRRAMLTSHNEHIDNLIGLTVLSSQLIMPLQYSRVNMRDV
jgi:hypothetical protein